MWNILQQGEHPGRTTRAYTGRTMKPIPIKAAELIAKKYGYSQVVIIARGVGVGEHCTTYGIDQENCDVAVRIGDFLKYKVMGWIKENHETRP